MMQVMMKTLLGMFLLTGAAWAGGVRFHPEVLSDNFFQSQDVYHEVKMTNGKKVVGKFLSQNEKGITVEMGGGNVVIPKEEVASDREIPREDIESGAYSEWMVTAPKVDVFSYKEDDNLFLKMVQKKEKKKAAPAKAATAPMTAGQKARKYVEDNYKGTSSKTSSTNSLASDSYKKMLQDNKTSGLDAPSFSTSITPSSEDLNSSMSDYGGSSVYTGGAGGYQYVSAPTTAQLLAGKVKSSSSGSSGGYNGGKYGSDYMKIISQAQSKEAMANWAEDSANQMQEGRNPIVECLKYGNCPDKNK